MIFKFGKGKKLSDLVKLAEFLEKEGIEYTMETDVQLSVGPTPETSVSPTVDDPSDPEVKHISQAEADARRAALGISPVKAENFDPMWVPNVHDGKACQDRTCKEPAHYGGIPL